MTGSFSSIHSALSGIRYNQVALDLASNNITNAGTEGYVRRRLVGESVGGPTVPALWSRYDGHGDGVRVASVQRMVDPLLDTRLRREHGTLSYLSTQVTVLQRVETGIGEPGPHGVAAALLDLRAAWQDLANNPGGDAARQQVLGRAATLADTLRSQVANVAGEEADQRVRFLSAVDQVNTAAVDLAQLNRTIASMEANGTDVGVLHDRRDALALRLSELTGAVATVGVDGMMAVTVGGVPLVTGTEAAALTVTGGVTPAGDDDGAPISFAVVGTSGSTPLAAAAVSGEIGAVSHLLDTTLPNYRAGLDQVARSLADSVNAQHALGFDANGLPGGAFFTYDPLNPGASLAVAITDPDAVAAAAVAGTLDGSNADALSGASGVDEDYQQLVNGFGNEVASLARRTANQEALAGSVDAAWEQQAGVNLDEETVTMMTAQRAYEAAARLLTTLDAVLDTLINRTGLVGR